MVNAKKTPILLESPYLIDCQLQISYRKFKVGINTITYYTCDSLFGFNFYGISRSALLLFRIWTTNDKYMNRFTTSIKFSYAAF